VFLKFSFNGHLFIRNGILHEKLMRFVIAVFTVVSMLTSCGAGYTFEGKVIRIDAGKDGYTAIIVTSAGDTMNALMSRVNMEGNYIKVKTGEMIQVEGDTSHLRGHLHIVARKIKRK
jgi:hypothetical protein